MRLGREAAKGAGYDSNGVCLILLPLSATSTLPCFPWTCVSNFAGTGPRRPIKEVGARGEIYFCLYSLPTCTTFAEYFIPIFGVDVTVGGGWKRI